MSSMMMKTRRIVPSPMSTPPSSGFTMPLAAELRLLSLCLPIRCFDGSDDSVDSHWPGPCPLLCHSFVVIVSFSLLCAGCLF